MPMTPQDRSLRNVGIAAGYRALVMSTIQELGIQLRAARQRTGLRMKDAAAAAGRTYQWLDHVEAGRRERLLLSDIESVAAAYGLRLWVRLAPRGSEEPVFLAPAVAHLAGLLSGVTESRLRRLGALLRAAVLADDQHLDAATVLLGGEQVGAAPADRESATAS